MDVTQYQYNSVKQYYAKWLDMAVEDMDKSFHITSSALRSIAQFGFSKPHKVYCLFRQGHLSISCKQELIDSLSRITNNLEQAVDIKELTDCLTEQNMGIVNHSIAYYHSGIEPEVNNLAIKLRAEHYQQFLKFFITENPGSETDWLKEYFDTMVSRGYAYGCFEAEKLVAAGDLPGIPFMEDVIVETGICTLEEYRNRGYAKAIIGNGIAAILKDGKVPIWSCSYANIGSNALAKSVGFIIIK